MARLIRPFASAVRKISRSAAQIAACAHRAVTMIAVDRALRRGYGDVSEIDAETVTLGIAIGKKPRLQHLVR